MIVNKSLLFAAMVVSASSSSMGDVGNEFRWEGGPKSHSSMFEEHGAEGQYERQIIHNTNSPLTLEEDKAGCDCAPCYYSLETLYECVSNAVPTWFAWYPDALILPYF